MFDKIVLAFQHQKVNKIRVKRWKNEVVFECPVLILNKLKHSVKPMNWFHITNVTR